MTLTVSAPMTTIIPGTNVSILVPDYSNSVNYTGIALSSIIGKNFDFDILRRYEGLLVSTGSQFTLAAERSTSKCSTVNLRHFGTSSEQ